MPLPLPLRVAFIDHAARISGAEIELVRLVEAAEDIEATVLLAEHGPLEARPLAAIGRMRPGMRTAVIPVPVPLPPRPVEISPAVRRVGMVGRLAPWKGQHVFLRAFAEAFPSGTTTASIVGAAMFGEHAYAEELRTLAEQLGIAERVEFRGFRNDVQAELERLDLFVHASTATAPFGPAVLEGMAAGLPVVAVRGGGPSEYIRHGEHGLLPTPRPDEGPAPCE